MIFNFVNGTAIQKALWEEAIGLLLNLPGEALPLTASIEFVPSLSGANATSFAETIWAYDSATGMMRIRNDAPGFGDLDASLIAEAAGMGLHYDATVHFHETAAHETGHAVFAAISHGRRLEIAGLFGVDTDDPAVLQPSGKEWQDRIGEGIAETFKEAFLPSRYRVFPNRTNHKISYSEYPRFRRIIREGLEEMEGSGEGEAPAGTPVPAYHLDVFKVRVLPTSSFTTIWSEDESHQLPYGGRGGTGLEGLYGYNAAEWGTAPEGQKQYGAYSATDVMLLRRGTEFKARIQLPYPQSFFEPAEAFAGFKGVFTPQELHENPEFKPPLTEGWNGVSGEKAAGIGVAIYFTYMKAGGKIVCWDHVYGSVTGFIPIFFGAHPNFPTGCWVIVKGDRIDEPWNQGEEWSIPIGDLELSSVVPNTAPTVETCGGDRARVRIFAYIFLTAKEENMPSLETIQSRLPSFEVNTREFPCHGAFCYPYFSTLYPDESGHDWPAVHKGDRDDEAFVLYPIGEFTNNWGIDMSQFDESGLLPYSIEEEGGITT